jgi:hypothetical protein
MFFAGCKHIWCNFVGMKKKCFTEALKSLNTFGPRMKSGVSKIGDWVNNVCKMKSLLMGHICMMITIQGPVLLSARHYFGILYLCEFMWRKRLNSDDDPLLKILEEVLG